LDKCLDILETVTIKQKPIMPLRIIPVWFMLASVWRVLAVDPTVSNVQAKQREGSRLMDITYDVVDPDSPTLTVYLKVSADGGKTWKGPVELVSGDVGQHIVPGAAKKLVWDAGKEMANQYGANFRYKVGASDQWLPPKGMALIPGGGFQMGHEVYAPPVHTVTVSGFAMDKWEVSIELWRSVRTWGLDHGYDLVAGDTFGPGHPVYNVSWLQAVKWNNARSELEGKVPAYYEDLAMKVVYRNGDNVPLGVKWGAGYRLPTEAEWERAARGGIEGKLYPWGTDEINKSLANYYESDKSGTTPIGFYNQNSYGLFDVLGNVAEWCWDYYGPFDLEQKNDPRGFSVGNSPIPREAARVIRGGCWNSWYPSIPNRGNVPGWLFNYYGFRSVLPPGQP
jgi:formylglycine-generating enzyme required for sulfatase activity